MVYNNIAIASPCCPRSLYIIPGGRSQLWQVSLLPQDHGPLRVLGQGEGGRAQGRDVRVVQEVQGQVP